MADRSSAVSGASKAERQRGETQLDAGVRAATKRYAGSTASLSAGLLKAATTTVCCLALAHCSTTGDKMGRTKDPKYGVYASPRIVAGTEPIDPSVSRHGIYLVGKPYQVAGKRYVPREDRNYEKVGLASWYGDDFHGRLTANGEVFDMHDITAAHATMPLPSYARVTNMANGNSIVVRVNDRGPYHGGRVIDVSRRAADLLAFRQQGVGRVKVEYLGRALQTGSDEKMLLATLRTDGSSAPLPSTLGGPSGTMIASGESAPAVPAQAGMVVAYQSEQAKPMPAAWSTGPAAVVAGMIALPPERPIDLDTIPNAATPISASAKPLQIPSATAVAPVLPAKIPLPPQRSADAGPTGLSPLDGGPLRLRIADIVGGSPKAATALAFAEDNANFVMHDEARIFVDGGVYSDKASAERLRWVLSQSGDATLEALDGQETGTLWRVKAGPFAARGDADAAAIMARNAGASDAAVID